MLDIIAPCSRQLAIGLWVSLQVAGGGFLLALVLAFALVPLMIGKRGIFRRLLDSCVAVMQAAPELPVIFMIFYGGTVLMTVLAGSCFQVGTIAAGIPALAAVSFAYLIEILRSALQGIPKGLGMIAVWLFRCFESWFRAPGICAKSA